MSPNTSTTQSPGRPRSATADQAILVAAIYLLKTEGYARMSIEAVAAAAGVGKTTIYRRYRNKGELVIAALETFVRRPRVPESGSTRADLETVLNHFHTNVMSGLGISTLGTLMVEEERHPEFIARFRKHIIEPRRDVFRAILRRGVDRGELRPDLDIDMCIDFLTGGLVMRRFAGGMSRPDHAQRAVDALWLGIVPGSPA